MKREKVNLTSTNKLANSINMQKLADIDEPEYCFDAILKGEYKSILYGTLIEENLKIKKGARIMFIRNSRDFVNGDFGIITDIDTKKECIHVSLDNGNQVQVSREIWELLGTEHLRFGKKWVTETYVRGSVKQFPMRLAWAFSIHKSQGMTFDEMIFNNGSPMFECGQLYVALSRCRTLEGITLLYELKIKDVKVSDRVKRYYKYFLEDDRYIQFAKELEGFPTRNEWPYEDDMPKYREFCELTQELKESL